MSTTIKTRKVSKAQIDEFQTDLKIVSYSPQRLRLNAIIDLNERKKENEFPFKTPDLGKRRVGRKKKEEKEKSQTPIRSNYSLFISNMMK